MNTLRRYIVAIVAVAVAFAGGVALGGGPLQGASPEDDSQQLASQNAELSGDLVSLKDGRQVDAAFADQVTDPLVKGRLADTPIALVVMPGVDDATTERMRDAIGAAGGQVTSTITLTDKLLDPGQKSYVQSVVDNSLTSVDGVGAGRDAYETIGRLAARAYTTLERQTPVDDTVTRIDGQLGGAGLVRLEAEPQNRAGLVLVLDSGENGRGTEASARRTIASHVIDGWMTGTAGAVLVGPSTSASDTGLFTALDDVTRQRTSSFDALDSAVAPVATVLTLVEVRSGSAGHAYGTVDGDVSLPPGLGG